MTEAGRGYFDHAFDGAKATSIRDPKLSKAGIDEHLKILLRRFLTTAEE